MGGCIEEEGLLLAKDDAKEGVTHGHHAEQFEAQSFLNRATKVLEGAPLVSLNP